MEHNDKYRISAENEEFLSKLSDTVNKGKESGLIDKMVADKMKNTHFEGDNARPLGVKSPGKRFLFPQSAIMRYSTVASILIVVSLSVFFIMDDSYFSEEPKKDVINIETPIEDEAVPEEKKEEIVADTDLAPEDAVDELKADVDTEAPAEADGMEERPDRREEESEEVAMATEPEMDMGLGGAKQAAPAPPAGNNSPQQGKTVENYSEDAMSYNTSYYAKQKIESKKTEPVITINEKLSDKSSGSSKTEDNSRDFNTSRSLKKEKSPGKVAPKFKDIPDSLDMARTTMDDEEDALKEEGYLDASTNMTELVQAVDTYNIDASKTDKSISVIKSEVSRLLNKYSLISFPSIVNEDFEEIKTTSSYGFSNKLNKNVYYELSVRFYKRPEKVIQVNIDYLNDYLNNNKKKQTPVIIEDIYKKKLKAGIEEILK